MGAHSPWAHHSPEKAASGHRMREPEGKGSLGAKQGGKRRLSGGWMRPFSERLHFPSPALESRELLQPPESHQTKGALRLGERAGEKRKRQARNGILN